MAMAKFRLHPKFLDPLLSLPIRPMNKSYSLSII
nr:MAG TPA: hypothetical protein [Bacteriophage sp.]